MSIVDNIYKKKEKLQEEIKERALKEAKRIAYILVKRFGATRVILYGSLLKEKYFDSTSDIDIAVEGLGDMYFRAYGYCLELSRFNLDIKAYEDVPADFRGVIEREGRILYAKR